MNDRLRKAFTIGTRSLVKAVHDRVNGDESGALAMIEVHREDVASLPLLLARLRETERRCLVFCDDLSFDGRDTTYKSLKAVLEGGIEGGRTTCCFMPLPTAGT